MFHETFNEFYSFNYIQIHEKVSSCITASTPFFTGMTVNKNTVKSFEANIRNY